MATIYQVLVGLPWRLLVRVVRLPSGSEGRHLGIIVNDVYVYREMPIHRSVGEACILTPSPIIVTGLLPQIVMEDL